ncbi:MAG TPA: hypothetical protein VK503_03540 [Candidatus Bathyarchaeia archaeon]|nr:hypothetical protein [Candidatus Bathyarchaeia archaeon]
MFQRCPLCERQKEEGAEFCSLHQIASINLENGYASWRKAFDNLERMEYYAKIEQLQDAGTAVKEVIQHLRRKNKQP